MIATLNDIGIKRYIEQLAGVTFDKDLHENPSLVNKAKKGKVSNVDKTKAENLDNITTPAGLPYFKQARRHMNIIFLKVIFESYSNKSLLMIINNLQLTVSEVQALYRYLKEVIQLRPLSVFEESSMKMHI